MCHMSKIWQFARRTLEGHMRQLKLLSEESRPQRKNNKNSNAMTWGDVPEQTKLEVVQYLAQMFVKHQRRSNELEANDEQ